MHGVEWVWLIMVSALVVSHVDWDGCVKRWKEVVGTCGHTEKRKGHKYGTNAVNNETFLKAGQVRRALK